MERSYTQLHTTSSVPTRQDRYPWWATVKVMDDGTEIWWDRRSDFERAVGELETHGHSTRDNTLVYDCGPGGLEVEYHPLGWMSADKLYRRAEVKLVTLPRYNPPTDAELRRNPLAHGWYVPGLTIGEFTVHDSILRRETGSHATAGTSPYYHEHRRKNAQRAKQRVRRLVRKYMSTVRMWTLTFHQNVTSVREADRAFRAAMRRLRNYFQSQGKEWRYIAVREFQRRGAIHYHLLVNQYVWKPKTYRGQRLHLAVKGLLMTDDPTKAVLYAAAAWRAVEAVRKDRESHAGQISMNEVWPYGHNYVVTDAWKDKHGRARTRQATWEGRRRYDRLSGYLAKYITKSIDDPEIDAKLQGHHLYLRSQGMSIVKLAVWSNLRRIYEWLRRQNRRIRQERKIPVTISTDRGDIITEVIRIDTT